MAHSQVGERVEQCNSRRCVKQSESELHDADSGRATRPSDFAPSCIPGVAPPPEMPDKLVRGVVALVSFSARAAGFLCTDGGPEAPAAPRARHDFRQAARDRKIAPPGSAGGGSAMRNRDMERSSRGLGSGSRSRRSRSRTSATLGSNSSSSGAVNESSRQ